MPEMSETELRALFHAVGHEKAPAALHAAVMEQVFSHATASVVKPLIAPRQWMMAAFVLVIATALAWVDSLQTLGGYSSKFTSSFHVDLSNFGHFLHHASWLAITMGVVFVLTLLDQALARAQPRSAH